MIKFPSLWFRFDQTQYIAPDDSSGKMLAPRNFHINFPPAILCMTRTILPRDATPPAKLYFFFSEPFSKETCLRAAAHLHIIISLPCLDVATT